MLFGWEGVRWVSDMTTREQFSGPGAPAHLQIKQSAEECGSLWVPSTSPGCIALSPPPLTFSLSSPNTWPLVIDYPVLKD